MKWGLLVVFLFLFCSTQNEFPVLRGDDLGQKSPGKEAELFAPGVVSTGMYNRDIAIMPDGSEIYFGVVLGRYDLTAIVVTKRVNGKWSEPEVTEFSNNPEWFDLEPCISPDGQKLFFLSNRPDTANGEFKKGDEDIWVMDRVEDGWSEPYNLGPPVNSNDEEYFPSVTNDGTIYFTRQEKGSPIGFIYRSRLKNGKYTEPEKLPEQVNSGQAQYNAFVAPDESYIIVPVYGREDSFGGTDYYISFRDQNDRWTEPLNMGEKINSSARSEYSPFVSRDGNYLFFMSDKLPEGDKPDRLTYEKLKKLFKSPLNGNPNIFWIDAKIIEDLKQKAI